jgi:sugar lactone lactonase YvrE
MLWSRRGVVAGGLALGGCASVGRVTNGAPGGAMPALYYLGQGEVLRFADGATETLVDRRQAAPRGVNDGIALDVANGHIYWTNMGRAAERDGYVMRCDLDGANVRTIVAAGATHTPKQLKIDHKGSKLYWSDREGMAIQRCNLDGSGLETLLTTGDPVADAGDQTRWCVGIALDVARGQIYWSQKGGDNAGQGVIRRMKMERPAGMTADARTDIETLFASLPEPIDLDLDLATRTLYWSDRGDNTISRAPMDPKAGVDPAKRADRQVLVSGLQEAIGVALDLAGGRMAYTSLGGELGVAALDGANARLLSTHKGLLTGVAWG